MNANTEMLNYIYQNSQMGTETINQILEVVEDEKFSDQLSDQLKEYNKIKEDSVNMLHTSGHMEKGIGNLAKISTYFNIGMQTMSDNSPSHIAGMLIEGSTMGVIDATKNLRKYKGIDKDVISLGEKLLKTEESNINNLKKFL